jgi:D-3-phosphoglycerate dehydrogenase
MEFKVVSRVGLPLTIAEEMLSKIGAKLVRAPLWTEDDIVQHAADADAIIAGATEPFTGKAIRALAKCKVISRYGIGFSNVDVEEATRQGIPVAVVVDASVHEVSDFALSCILAFSRKLFLSPRLSARADETRGGDRQGARPRAAERQTLGLVGMEDRQPGGQKAKGPFS